MKFIIPFLVLTSCSEVSSIEDEESSEVIVHKRFLGFLGGVLLGWAFMGSTHSQHRIQEEAIPKPSQQKSGKNIKGYGPSYLPSYSNSEVCPPASDGKHKNAPPSPSNAGTSYGETGPRPDYWNGQYYPYADFGYKYHLFPHGVDSLIGPSMPSYFAGPFGFYGKYGTLNHTESIRQDAVVKNFYVNGSSIFRASNDTNPEDQIYNGTYYSLAWESGQYTVIAEVGGYYSDGVQVSNKSWVNGSFVNGPLTRTFAYNVNPNVTADGAPLKENLKSAGDSLRPTYLLLVAVLLL